MRPATKIERLFEWLADDAAARAGAPDVSGDVMARLGFRATDARVARRRRFIAIVRRCAGTMAVLAVLGCGLWWIDGSRRAMNDGAAFEDLMRSSLRENRDRINRVVDSLAPLSLPAVGTPARDRSIVPSATPPAAPREFAVAPFRKA
ncbi:MAG: hypothetical protein SGJ09_11350 [Phycisphaerae bacterium]|nr:hypothetical protein [Phycisphaerae bacterium]